MTFSEPLNGRLEKSGIDPAWAAGLGVREAMTVEELPEHARWAGEKPGALPALVFPWRQVDGSVVEQVNPATPVLNGSGTASKYLWPKGCSSSINVPVLAGAGADTTVIVEGTKQTLAALRYAEPTWQIVGIGGCSSWTSDGIADPGLASVVDGMHVVILFDADLDRNLEVWTAAQKLGAAVMAFGALDVRYGAATGRGTTGIDDVLGGLPESKRAETLARMVNGASKRMPAKPKPSAKAERIDWIALGKLPRPVFNVKSDRLDLARWVSDELKRRWDRNRLFQFGDTLSMLQDDVLRPVDSAAFLHLANVATDPREEDRTGNLVPAVYDSTTVTIMWDLSRRSFSTLDRVSRVPFVREDGSVCTTPGYDEDSNTLLVPSHGLDEVVVPDEPSEEDVRSAVKLLLEDWLGDFPFAEQADRANALGLILTPFIRSRVPLAPLAVLDGLGAGVGKGLLSEVMSVLVLGEQSSPVHLPSTDDEVRKSLHALLSEGRELIMIDEAHTIQGAALALTLTAPSVSGRVLGETRVASYPNRATWIAAGNNVVLRDDLFRRVYRIRLAPTKAGWETRGGFRHPNLSRWTTENRAALMGAALTLVRHWFAAGCPEADNQVFSFGSFEPWQAETAGILSAAGVDGFLGNELGWRDEAAEDRMAWRMHLRNLRNAYGTDTFTVEQVRSDVVLDLYADPVEGMGGEADPRGDRTAYNRALGGIYRRRVGAPTEDGLALCKGELEKEGGRKRWYVRVSGDYPHVSSESQRVQRGTSSLTSYGRSVSPADDHEKAHTHSHEGGTERTPLDSLTLWDKSTGVAEAPGSDNSADSDQERHDPPYGSPSDPRESVPGTPSMGVMAVDFETCKADLLYAPGGYEGPFIRLMAYDNGEVRGTTSDPDEMRRILTAADRLIVHDGWRFDLPAAAHHLDMDAAALIAKSDDLIVAARLAEPPRDTKGRMDKYGLDDLGERHLGEGKTDALKALARRYKGFDKIPVDDPDYIAYAAKDVDLTRRLAEHVVAPDPAYYDHERRAAGIAATLSLTGLRVDVPLAVERDAALKDERQVSRERLHKEHGFPLSADPAATNAGRARLNELRLDAGFPRWPTTATGALSVSRETLVIARPHVPAGHELGPVLDMLIEMSSEQDFASQVLEQVKDGRVHPEYRISGVNGRWSVQRPNIMGTGKREERLLTDRDVILPEPGHVFIQADLKGIDNRSVAGLSGDTAYAALLAPGVEINAELARMFYGEGVDFKSVKNKVKAIGHGINFGRSPGGVRKQNDIPLPEIQRAFRAYFERFARLAEWIEDTRSVAEGGGVLDNGHGRGLRVHPDKFYTEAVARVAASCTRDLAMRGIFAIQDAGLLHHMRMFVHDEVVLSVPEDEAADVLARVVECMSFDWHSPSGLVIPIIAEPSANFGRRWSDVYKGE